MSAVLKSSTEDLVADGPSSLDEGFNVQSRLDCRLSSVLMMHVTGYRGGETLGVIRSHKMKVLFAKILSGGQTGADRAALDWAIEHGVPHGGWCPKGRKAEDGQIDPKYELKETPNPDYVQRTEWNVRDSAGTVVFSIASVLTGGSKKTVDLARKHQKPVLHLSRDGGPREPEQELLRFLRKHHIQVLNAAGPRASKEPEVENFVREVLDKVWAIA